MRSLAPQPPASITLSCSRKPHRRRQQSPPEPADRPQPSDPPDDPQVREEPDDPEEFEVPCTDDAYWDVFIPDDDQYDPLPEPGDFWNDDGRNDEFPNDE